MVFDIVIHNYVNKDPFFIAHVAHTIAGDRNNTVIARIADQYRSTHIIILTKLDKTTLDVMKDLNSILPKGITVDVSAREPNEQELYRIKTELKG